MYRLLTILLFLSLSAKSQVPQYASSSTTIAGEPFHAVYYIEEHPATLHLVLQHSLGLYALKGNPENCQVAFDLPLNLLESSGDISLLLLDSAHQLLRNDKLTVQPDTRHAPVIEAFCGPKQILTGGEDYTAVIGTVLDSLDNPWPPQTPVDFNYTFKNRQKKKEEPSKPLYAYHRFFSDNQSGHPVITVSSQGEGHTEFELTLYPNFPQPYTLKVDRNHSFADGKDINKISTSIIKDRYGNIVSDGTLVRFKITDSEGNTTHARAPSIQGVATIKLSAPEKATKWNIATEIDQFVKGKNLQVDFKPFTMPYNLRFENGQIVIGPIKGAQGQLVTHHTEINVEVREAGHLIETIKAFTDNGMAMVIMPPAYEGFCRYQIKTECGGQEQFLEIEM